MPPRRGIASGNNPDFLWVNRTPDSDRLSASRQERDELRTITSHARTWRAALRRQQRLASAQTGASHAQSIVGWGRPESIARSEPSSSETSAAPSPAPLVPLASDDTAPFAYLDEPEDAWWSQNAFQYATQTWLPLIFQGLDAFNLDLMSQDSVNNTITVIIQGCLHNRMHMFSLLSASTGYLKFILKAHLDKGDTPEYCTGKALQYLRYYLASNPRIDELVVFDLIALSAFERYVGNFEGARTHLGMVQHLIESLGGFDVIDPPLRLVCWQWDILVAAGSAEPPLLPLTWDPGSLPQPRMQQIQLDLMQNRLNLGGSYLYEYASSTHSEFSEVVINLVQWFQAQQYDHLHPSSESPIQRWAIRRSYALAHRLLSLPATASGGQTVDKLVECIQQACLIIISEIEIARSVRAGPQAKHAEESFSWYNIPQLRQALTELLQRGGAALLTPEREEMALWIACMAAQKSQQENAEHGDWFLNIARQIARKRHIRSVQDLADVLARYMYNMEPDGWPNTARLETVPG